jgi:hypothetical protein
MKGAMGDHDSVLALRVTSTGVAARSVSPLYGLASSLAQPRTGRATRLPWRISRWDDSSPTSSGTQSIRPGGRSSQDLYLAARVPEAVYQLRIAQ